MLEIRRVATDAEHEVALEINNSVLPEHAITIENVRSYAASVPQEHFLAWEDGRAVGTGSAALEPRRAQAYLRLIVRPDECRRGVGTALFRAASRWAAEHGRDELETYVDDSEPDARTFLEHRGFRPIGRELKVALDLTALEPPPVDPPEGTAVVTWAERPELIRGIYEVAVEAYADVPGNEDDSMEPFEDWLAHDMGGVGDKPEATFVALAGDEVVGYSKFSLTEAQPKTAFHDMTGVKRAWRGRGVAGALKRAQIAWAKEAGYERLLTNNEERNAPIRKLNARLGYTPGLGRTLMRGRCRTDARA